MALASFDFCDVSVTSQALHEKIPQWLEVARKKELNDLSTLIFWSLGNNKQAEDIQKYIFI